MTTTTTTTQDIVDIVSVIGICDDARAVAATPVPADEALRCLCAAVPAAAWKAKRKTGWGRTHYADRDANGTCGSHYEARRGASIDAASVSRTGGQNSGGYEIDDSGLWLDEDGSLWCVVAVEGSWSQWQGSSSGYEYTWGRYRGEYDLAAVVVAVRDLVAAYRDRCRARRAAGSKEAGELLAALTAAGY